jgi:hypothetical protein
MIVSAKKTFCGMPIDVKDVILSVVIPLEAFFTGCQFNKKRKFFSIYTAEIGF